MGDTTPTFLILLFSLCIAIISVNKEKIIVPIIIAMFFLPADISIKFGQFNFYAIRILAIVGIAKLYFTTKNIFFQFNTIDNLFFIYNIFGTIIYIFASYNILGAFIFKSGESIDSILLYTVFRHIILSKESLKLIIKTFFICVIILLPFAIYEFYTANNLFSIVGRNAISIRDGEIRASCTFSHSILFGSFAAATIPILWANYVSDRSIKSFYKIIPVLCCIFYIYACSSSGPVIALVVTVLLLFFFKWKEYGPEFAWLVSISALFLHFIREKPLWHFLFVRISIKQSSTGFHRYLLIEAAIKEFWNWWLLGYGDRGPQWHLKYWSYNHAKFTDVTNQYIFEGVNGGFITMLLFLFLCSKAIKTLWSFSISQSNKMDQWLIWGFFVMMISHCVSFLSVTYFGQITMLFYLTIAVAAFAFDEK